MYTRPRPRVFLFVTVLYSIMCLHSRRTPYLAPCSLITMYTKTRSICTRLHIGSPVREKLLCGPRVLHDRPLLPYIHPIHTRSTLQVKSVAEECRGQQGACHATLRFVPSCRTTHALFSFSNSSSSSSKQPPHNPHTDPTQSLQRGP